MTQQSTLSPDLVRRMQELEASGHRVFGPGPMTRGETTPTEGARTAGPGMHLQIADVSGRLIEGFGGTADEAARDALSKLEGYDPTGRTHTA
jgi:hypothetical protein